MPRASSAEEDIFVESIQSTKVWCHTGGGKGDSCAELWCHNSREVDCLAARQPHESSRETITCQYLGAYPAPKVLILVI